jgi:glycosyltransferase involved in cell wall biosynthesis
MISVVFSTKNGAVRLPRTLNSFCELNYENDWELIIVDNGSDDNTCEVIKSYQKFLPITLLHQSIPGKNAALNMAVEVVKGDAIVFTDDDIRAEKNWLNEIDLVLSEQKNYDEFAGVIEGEWENRPEQWILDWAPLGPLFAIKFNEIEGECLPGKVWGPNMVVRRHVFEDTLHRFNEDIGPNGTPHYPMGSETEFTKRMAKHGYKFYFSNRFKVHHWIAKSSVNEQWIYNRAYRLGKGVTLAQFELGEGIKFHSLFTYLIIYNILSPISAIVFNPRRNFWVKYKAKYYLGAARGMIKGYLNC